jgi:hypothetical protein
MIHEQRRRPNLTSTASCADLDRWQAQGGFLTTSMVEEVGKNQVVWDEEPTPVMN